ncbi:putative integral membrane acyltransferase [Fragilariopsis cylindrus CCMP1102]|uniref:Putative integral membrane acyltransferase n=1 Tax=Fragilariopsis cylindrus CCMP1102 TaxID=635003 RepID=A0A1E7F428_9STRA|nr:putative integral membrane acyltransferase [Fragilariopsis cylindrus CCMP1102]|eukprot:OEU12884.1 putative integral membrane acyltransferase [Fragilariopsis cylindrus CCMP1102]
MENNSTAFSILYANWDESNHQQSMYAMKTICITNILVAFATVLTQYVVSQWIWSNSTKSKHYSPIYLVSGIIFFILWSFLMNADIGLYYPLPIGYRIATPLLVIGGVPLNLLFCYLWKRLFTAEGEGEGEDSSHDETTTQVVAPLSVAKSTPLPSQEEEEDVLVTAANELEQGEQELTETTPTIPATKQKIDFINNIKIFLTCLVIISHVIYKFDLPFSPEEYILAGDPGSSWGIVVLAFIEVLLNSFFMHLFFFFSGYFCPSSLDKKGRYSFLFERVKRLGIPFVILGFTLYPYSSEGSYLFEGKYNLPYNVFTTSVAWFLLQLIIFNIAYAYICGEKWSPKVKCPSILALFGISLILGLAAGITTLFFPFFDNVITVPQFWISYWAYILFFFGGALAARNNWIEEIKVNKSRIVIYLWALVSAVVFGIIFITNKPTPALNSYFAFVYGIQCIPIGLAVTIFFMDFVNTKYFFTDFFSKSMYTAYLIQMILPVPAALKCWQLVMNATNINGTDGGWVMVGFLFSSVLALIFDWTLAYIIWSIPGVSKIL